jgi:hypothetical protein
VRSATIAVRRTSGYEQEEDGGERDEVKDCAEDAQTDGRVRQGEMFFWLGFRLPRA